MDATEINTRYDLPALVGNLRKSGASLTGPCPICGQGKDRFVLVHKQNGWRWYLRQCTHDNRTGYRTPIDFVMLKFGYDFKTAAGKMAAEMGGNLDALPHDAPMQPAPRPGPQIELNSPAWRVEAWQFVHRATCDLWECPQAEPAREYLFFRRGLEKKTCTRALLGFAEVYHRPAIVIPYFDEGNRKTYTILGVKLRFIDRLAQDDPHKRYGAPKFSTGETSKFYLYGMFGLCHNPDTLFLVEGDFNRNSIWQLAPIRTHVLSPGSETTGETQKAILRILAPKYKRVIVWMDNPERAKQLQIIMARPDAILLQSPQMDGMKYDANQLLQEKPGLLAEILTPYGLNFPARYDL